MQRPEDPEPETPGGRSAERLREFLAAHVTPGTPGAEVLNEQTEGTAEREEKDGNAPGAAESSSPGQVG